MGVSKLLGIGQPHGLDLEHLDGLEEQKMWNNF